MTLTAHGLGTIELLNPGIETAEHEPVNLSPTVASLAGKSVGLVENAAVLLTLIRERLVKEYGAKVGPTHGKVHYNRDLTDTERIDMGERADVALVAIGDCGSCTSYTVHDLITLEQLGVPTVAIVTEPFLPLAQGLAEAMGASRIRIAAINHPLYGIEERALHERVDAVVGTVVALLTGPQ